jgi:glycosyltransferase involved in cell wall biosynthesis
MGKTLIVYFGKYEGTSASSKRVRQLAAGLREAGDDACVISYRRGKRASREGAITWMTDGWGVEYSTVNVAEGAIRSPRVLWDGIALSSRLSELTGIAIRQRGFDRVYIYGSTWLGLREVLGRLGGTAMPVVADMNEWFRWHQGTRLEVLDQALFRRFCVPKLTGIVGISAFWAEYARAVAKPAILIPAMSDGEFDDLEPPGAGSFNVVYVGALLGRDLPQTMFKGLQLAAQQGCKFRFYIVGAVSPIQEATDMLQQLQTDPLLSARSEITGLIDRAHRARLREIYRNAGAFLLLRRNEWESRACFPTRLPEFLSCGRPVIVSNCGDAPLQLRHRESAWLLPEGDAPQELADAISHLAANPQERRQIGEAGRELAKSAYDFRLHGKRLNEFLDGLQ